MIKKLYTIYDSAAEFHDLPFPAMTDEDAVRMVGLSMRHPDSRIAMSPDDFSIWYHGEFDQREGEFHVHALEKRKVIECRFLTTHTRGEGEGAGEHLKPFVEQSKADGLNMGKDRDAAQQKDDGNPEA